MFLSQISAFSLSGFFIRSPTHVCIESPEIDHGDETVNERDGGAVHM